MSYKIIIDSCGELTEEMKNRGISRQLRYRSMLADIIS